MEQVEMVSGNLEDEAVIERNRKVVAEFKSDDQIYNMVKGITERNPSAITMIASKVQSDLDELDKDNEVIKFAMFIVSSLKTYLGGEKPDLVTRKTEMLPGKAGVMGFGATEDKVLTQVLTHIEEIDKKISDLETDPNGEQWLSSLAEIEALKFLREMGPRNYTRSISK